MQQSICKRCCQDVEAELHIFFECPYAKMIWRGSGMSNTIINSSNAILEERIEACFSCCTNRMVHLQELAFWILWHLWKSRNQLIFQQKQMHWKSLIQLAKTNAKEWKDMVVED